MLEVIIIAIWLMLPAYVPNSAAVLTGGGTPIDFGHKAWDGKRILGDGKTFRGLAGGATAGILVGIIQYFVEPFLGIGVHYHIAPIQLAVVLFSMSFGALLGDIVKSFFKRRIGVERGGPLPIADQLDFVAGAWALTYLFAQDWFTQNFTFWIIVAVLILTPGIHLLVNIIGYKLGKKDVWW